MFSAALSNPEPRVLKIESANNATYCISHDFHLTSFQVFPAINLTHLDIAYKKLDLHIASPKHIGGWENSRQLYKPETQSTCTEAGNKAKKKTN